MDTVTKQTRRRGWWAVSTRCRAAWAVASLAWLLTAVGCSQQPAAPETGTSATPTSTATNVAPAPAPTESAVSSASVPEGPTGIVQVTATTDGKPVGEVAVWLVGATGSTNPAAKRLVFHQKDNTFSPTVGMVMKGGVVEFVNDDTHLHNTYSHSPLASFSFNQPGAGSRSLLKVDKVGVIDVACHIHGLMEAWIVVVDTPAYAVTDAKGTVAITGVPPGTYAVKAWAAEGGEQSGSVTVTAGGTATVHLKFGA